MHEVMVMCVLRVAALLDEPASAWSVIRRPLACAAEELGDRRFLRRRAGSATSVSCARAMMSSIAMPNLRSGDDRKRPTRWQ